MENNFLGWDFDELVSNTAPEEAGSKSAEEFLQTNAPQHVAPATPVASVRQEAPTRASGDERAWRAQADEAIRAGSYRRHWPDKTRSEWNSNPIHSDGTVCSACGYKWHPADIMQDGTGRCFSCYMIEDKPQEVARYWQRYRENYGGKQEKHGETPAPKLVKLDSKEKK